MSEEITNQQGDGQKQRAIQKENNSMIGERAVRNAGRDENIRGKQDELQYRDGENAEPDNAQYFRL